MILKPALLKKNGTPDEHAIMSFGAIARCLNEEDCDIVSMKELDAINLSNMKNNSVTIYLVGHGNPGSIGFSLQDNLSAKDMNEYMKKFCDNYSNGQKLKQIIILACSAKNKVSTKYGSNDEIKVVSLSSEIENSNELLKNKIFALQGSVIASPNKQFPIVSVVFDPVNFEGPLDSAPNIAKNIDSWYESKCEESLLKYFNENIKNKDKIDKNDLKNIAQSFGKETANLCDDKIRTIYLLDYIEKKQNACKKNKFLRNEALIADENGDYKNVNDIYEEDPAKNMLFDRELWDKMSALDKRLGIVSKELELPKFPQK